ncbi:Flp pilus assembly complex ATPase component TadA [bacterium]|nr:Flp pilus assembly complex ATPase component TadA [bacterium]
MNKLQLAKTIAIIGPKAGVGKSVFASNLAYALEKQSKGKKVLILDLDPQDCGDISVLLGARVNTSLMELSKGAFKMLRTDLISQIHHHEKQIYTLQGSLSPNGLQNVDIKAFVRLLQLCQQEFDYLVVDLGSEFDAMATEVFEHSDAIYFVTTPEILTLHRANHALHEIQNMAFESSKIQLVVNRFDPKEAINEAVIQQKLNRNILALLPNASEAIRESVETGRPLFSYNPRYSYAQVVEEIARQFIKHHVTQQKNSNDQAKTFASINDDAIELQNSQNLAKQNDHYDEIKKKIHAQLIEVMDFRHLSVEEFIKQDEKSIEDLRVKTKETIFQLLDQIPEIKSRQERQFITKQVLDEALGLGPLEDLLADPSVTEIMVNRFDQIYVEQQGKLQKTKLKFTGDQQLLGVIERIVAPIGRRIDEKTPMVDARLTDGSRVHAIIPPLSIDGPMLTIRKFTKSILSPQHLIDLDAFTPEISDFLRACVQAKLNVLVSGGTGTGKTTLLNVLASFIPDHERIITVEDSAELQLAQEHVGRLESRPANLQGEGAIPIRELVRNTLRMRPDRIIIGECRGAEALDMLQAMNTGHDGSLATIHANTPKDCIARLETLVMFAGMELPSRAIREQIAGAVDLIIQLTRMSDGSRKITAVTEVLGMSKNKTEEVELQDIFIYKSEGLDKEGKVKGYFQATGLIPQFAQQFKQKGITMPKGLFSQ